MTDYVKYFMFGSLPLPCCLACGAILISDSYINKHFVTLHPETFDEMTRTS